jgi:hypothetical protein
MPIKTSNVICDKRPVDLSFIQAQGAPTTLAVQANPNDTTITVADATGFVDGNTVGFFCATEGCYYFGRQVGAPSGNIITLDTPVDQAYVVGSNVIRALREMAVDGSTTTQVFQVGPIGQDTALAVMVTRINLYLQDGTSMDDGMFGGLGAALTYGVVFRRNNGIIENYWNVKTNGELSEICAGDFNYSDKAPGGSNGARGRNTFSGEEKHATGIRLKAGDTLELLIQDDLTGLESFTAMAQGHLL